MFHQRPFIARHVSEYRLAANLQSKQNEQSENIRQSDIPGSILNMCFLNLESMFPKTRSAAYNLLAALAEQFDFPVTLLETQNMCVPHNTGDLVVKLSEQVSVAKPFMTPQFLREALRGFQKISLPYKYLCLKYMRPWIKNLSITYAEAKDDAEQVKRITEWFQELTKTTIEMSDIYPALLSEVWGEISRNLALVEISMSCLLQEAIATGLENTKQLDILNDLVVTLASNEASHLVVKIIVDKCLQVFDQEIKNADQPLENNPPWAKVIIYCRFLLMLSFQDRIKVIANMPILMHIVTLMIGRGSVYVRATIHALVLNIIHSLATVLKFEKEEKKKMQEYLARLMTNDFRRIFMGNTSVSCDPFVSVKEKEKGARSLDAITMWDIETITNFFVEVQETCYKVAPELREEWFNSWYSICQNEALQLNPTHLPRLLAVNGVLIQQHTQQAAAVTKSLSFVMQCLIQSFTDYPLVQSNVDLPVAALLCLGQYCLKISPEDPILHRMMLIPMTLLSASDQVLFPAVVHLLKCVLKSVSKSTNFLKQCCGSLETYFNTYCRDTDANEELVSKLEKSTGISFRVSFSFAISSLLMKGLTISQTRERTAQMCASLVKLCAGQAQQQQQQQQQANASEMLGYLAALIPMSNYIELIAKYLPLPNNPVYMNNGMIPVDIDNDDFVSSTITSPTSSAIDPVASGISNLAATPMTMVPNDIPAVILSGAGSAEEAPVALGETIFYLPETYSSPCSGLLFVRYLLTVVQNMEFDNDKIAIYNVLKQSFTKLTQVFIPVYPHVMPRVISVYNQASSTRIAEVSLSLINTMMATETEAAINPEKDKDPLKEIAFTGLTRAGSFKAIADKQRAESLQLMLECVKSLSADLPAMVPPALPSVLAHLDKASADEKAAQKKKQLAAKNQSVTGEDTSNAQ